MQKYTKLKLQELTEQMFGCERRESDKTLSAITARMPYSGHSNVVKVEIRVKCLDKLIEELLSAEKNALLKVPPLPDGDYFDTLKKEIVQIADKHIQAIYSQSYGRDFEDVTKTFYQEAQAYKRRYASRIENKIDVMQEELRLKIVPSGGAIINVGGDVAVLNTGIIYGSIHGQIEKMKGTNAAELAELFDKLLTAIKNSQIKEDDKIEQMQNVELLVTQYEAPPEQKKRGWIVASLNFLSVATNLSTLWQQFEPTIKAAFKPYIP